MIQIVPSILSADFARLADDIGKVERGGAKMLHVDIMDGHFVPNLTIGPPVVKSIRKTIGLTLDLHLMITDPDRFAPLFIEGGATASTDILSGWSQAHNRLRPTERPRAAQMFFEAADANELVAQYRSGMILMNGEGAPRNRGAPFGWRLAAGGAIPRRGPGTPSRPASGCRTRRRPAWRPCPPPAPTA